MPWELLATYQPEILLGYKLDNSSYRRILEKSATRPSIQFACSPTRQSIHPDLALLLSTSGSTGSPKFVRLSRSAVAANARQIAEALAITPDDIGIAHLPMHYSYGLSIRNLAPDRRSLRFSDDRAGDRTDVLASYRRGWRHTLPGRSVSLQRPRSTLASNVSCLRPSGPAPRPEGISIIKPAGVATTRSSSVAARFVLSMYGQTEAGPRITTLQSDEFPENSASVGRALSGGLLSIIGDDGKVQAPGIEGNVVYQGPNVMMGYATGREDLALPDVLGGQTSRPEIAEL